MKKLKESDYFMKNYFFLAENAYIDALADLNAEVERLRVPPLTVPTERANEPNRSPTATDHVKVPRVALPTFSGNQSDWESYKQRFTSLIKSKREYSEIDKLQYLLSTIEGKAAARLRGIEVTEANCKVASRESPRCVDTAPNSPPSKSFGFGETQIPSRFQFEDLRTWLQYKIIRQLVRSLHY